jgi:hypothetical protein
VLPEATTPLPATAGPEPLLVDLRRAAELTSLSERSLRRYADLGLAAARRVGRRLLFSMADLKAWVATGCPAPTPRAPARRRRA